MSRDTFVIGTRASRLARAQAGYVARRVERLIPGVSCRLEVVETRGDRDRNSSLESLGGTGVFVSGLERALQGGLVDCCVHSMKDLPSTLPRGLRVGAVPPRADAADVLVTCSDATLSELDAGASVATGSPRRRLQLLELRPDLRVLPARGNVDTRLELVSRGEVDAVVLAAAGLARLNRLEEATERFSVDQMVPAPGQGALCVEIREGDERALEVCDALDDVAAHAAVDAERLVMARLGAGCSWPLGVFARAGGDGRCRVDAYLGSVDAGRSARVRRTGACTDLRDVAVAVADELAASGLLPIDETRVRRFRTGEERS